LKAKIALRNTIARLLFTAGVTLPRRRARRWLSIVTFHRVLPDAQRRAYPYPGLVVTPSELEGFLRYFARHFDCGTLERQHGRHGRGEDPGRPLLALTFDDAQHDNYLYARPLLARFGMKATFFAPVSAVERQELLWHDRLGFAVLALLEQGAKGKERLAELVSRRGLPGVGSLAPGDIAQQAKRMSLRERLQLVDELVVAAQAGAPGFARLMTLEELGQMAAEGHEIGSHSMTHCMLPECDDASLAHEVGRSREILARRVGQPVDSFCYPNGNHDARTGAALAEAGYRRAVTTCWGLNSRNARPLELRRCDMTAEHVRDAAGGIAPSLVALRMSGLQPGLAA